VMFTMKFASIVLVEDHAILGEGLRALIEPIDAGSDVSQSAATHPLTVSASVSSDRSGA
jgi:hypothetical protein